MAEKPRTASNGAARLGLVDLDKLGPGLRRTVLALVDAEVRKEIRKAQAELLADGWTFLPGEMPKVNRSTVLVAVRSPDGATWVWPASWTGDFWRHTDGEAVPPGYVYAYRPLPEPPEVPR